MISHCSATDHRSDLMSSKDDIFICNMNVEEEWPSTLPTPPRSPDSNTPAEEADDEEPLLKDQDLEELMGAADALALLEDMQLDLYALGDDMGLANWSSLLANPNPNCQADNAGSSELRHDCMWSGKCDDSCKSRVRYNSEGSDIQLLPLTPACSPLRNEHEIKQEIHCSEIDTAAFVDPSVVLNYTPLSDHCYYQPKSQQSMNHMLQNGQGSSTGLPIEMIADPPLTVATPATPKKALWKREQYVLSDTPSESDESDDSDSNDDDEEEIDVVSVHSAPSSATVAAAAAAGEPLAATSAQTVRAHQRSLTTQHTSSQRSLLKSKNSNKAAHKRRRSGASPLSSPATPYLLTPVQSPQPSPAAMEYPMPKVTSSGRVVQPTNRSASFLEAQPQHSSRSDHHSRKRKRSDNPRHSKHVRSHGSRGSSDMEDPEKRREHNSMERKRRDDLRFAFQKLRELVPEVKDNPKAAKVIILAKAAEFSRRLQVQQQQLESQLRVEASRRRQLERRLSSLSNSV